MGSTVSFCARKMAIFLLLTISESCLALQVETTITLTCTLAAESPLK